VLGPLAVAAALTVSGIELSAMPSSLSKAGQLFIGVSLGIRFTPAFIRTASRWLGTVAIGTTGVIIANVSFALVLAKTTGLYPSTVLLGPAPGGMAEMTLTARALQLGVPLVTAFHVARTVSVMLLATSLYRFFLRVSR
jgi:membrane AbrB-like protein